VYLLFSAFFGGHPLRVGIVEFVYGAVFGFLKNGVYVMLM
jgi:hypothetical protein